MHQACQNCGLHLHCNSPVISGEGNFNDIKLIVISDFPGIQEDQENISFTGPSKKLFDNILGDRKSQIYFTNMVKCCPYIDPITKQGGTRQPSQREIDLCKTILTKELKMFNNDIPIMTLGNASLSGFIGPHQGINKELGIRRKVEIGGREFSLIPNYHPFSVTKNTHILNKFEQTINKAFANTEETTSPKYKLCNFEESIKEINNIIELYNNGKIPWVVFDIETSSLSPWKGNSIMFSFSHDASDTAIVCPTMINNTILFDHIKEYVDSVDEELIKANIVDLPDNQAKEVINNITKRIQSELQDKLTIPFDINKSQSLKINAAVKNLLETVPVIGHNIKFDLKFLIVECGLNIRKVKVFADTQIMAHQVYGRTFGSSLSLKELSRKQFSVSEDWELDIEFYLSKYRLIVDRHYANIPTAILYPYAGLDTFYTKKLYHVLAGSLYPAMVDITNEVTKLTIPLAEAEAKGVLVDSDTLKFLSESYKNAIKETESTLRNLPAVKKFINKKLAPLIELNSKKKKPKSIQELTENVFTLGSIPSLKEIFYGKDYYKLPILADFKTPKGEPQTGADVIEVLIKDHAKDEALEFLKNLDDYKIYNKIITTYIDGLQSDIHNGIYHPEFFITGTVTGRLSSGFHTLPSSSDIKRIFKSRWNSEGGLFLASDESQLELRIAASISEENSMIEEFTNGIDAHTASAAKIYKVVIEEVTSAQRKVGKIVNFAILFGKIAFTLAQDLLCSEKEAQIILDGFWSGRPFLKKFVENQHKFVMQNGFITTPMGRVIPILDAFSTERGHQNHAKRCSVNFPVQSSASDVVTVTSNIIYDEMIGKDTKSIFLGSVHDSLEHDVYPGELFKIIKLVKHHSEVTVRERYKWITCPLVMDVSLGTSWGGAIEFKVKEISDNHVILEGGEAMARDFKDLIAVAGKAYDVNIKINERKEIQQDKFSKDIFFRDRELWNCTLVLKDKVH